MNNPYRAMCSELVEQVQRAINDHGLCLEASDALMHRARALLAEPEAEGPTDEELLESAAKALGYKSIPSDETCLTAEAGEILAYGRAVLARWGRTAAAPVPVSERLPGPKDCDAEGRCWLGGHLLADGTPTWLLGYPAWAERFPHVHHFWLPANALPLPAPEGGEVSR